MTKMNIEVGEYIRTKQGDISKVECVEKEDIILEDAVWSKNDLYEKTNVLYFDDEEIAKHSKNIIDLIEVGDYVNGNRIDKFEIVTNNITNNKAIKEFGDIDSRHIIYDFGIKSIVTKEQFKNMEYRL